MNLRTALLDSVFWGSLLTALAVSVATAAAPQVAPNPENYEIEVGSSVGVPGGDVQVPVFLNFSQGMECTGVSFAVCSDWSQAQVNCVGGFPNDCVQNGVVIEGAATLSTNGGLGADFFNPTVESVPANGWTVGIVFSVAMNDSLPPQDGAELSVTTYQLLGAAGSVVPLTICEIGNPLVLLSVVTPGGALVPQTVDGEIQITGGGGAFIRGDADDSGVFNGLVDGLFVLAFAFAPGSPAPTCLETADSDDSGSFNGIVDGLYLLNHQFSQGPPPPPPFPDCGDDPDAPGLGCGPHTSCP